MTGRLAIAGLLVGVTVWAQEDEPILRATARLVQIGVAAQDKRGRALSGLKATDFRIKDNGKLRDIRIFAASDSDQNSPASVRSGEHAFTNTGAQQANSGAVTVIVIDYLNTRWEDQAFATRQFLQYLSGVKPQDHLAIYSVGGQGLQVLHDFTTDASDLVAALSRNRGSVVPDPAQLAALLTGSDSGARQAILRDRSKQLRTDRTELTLGAFEQLTKLVAGIPARKTLIWISGGFGSLDWGNAGRTAVNGYAPALMQAPAWAGHDNGVRATDSLDGSRSFGREIDSAARLFNQANVAVYPIEARGLRARIPGESNRFDDVVIDSTEENMLSIAAATGGRAFVDDNKVGDAIETAIASGRADYTLGFYADPKPGRREFHKIEITLLNHPGFALRYRRGYEDSGELPTSGMSRKQELEAAGWSPLDASGIPLTATIARGGQILVRIDLGSLNLEHRNDRWMGKVDMLIIERDEHGTEYDRSNDTIELSLRQTTYAELRKTGIPYQYTMEVNPNATYVRVVVRDMGTGNIGSLTIPLQRAELAKTP